MHLKHQFITPRLAEMEFDQCSGSKIYTKTIFIHSDHTNWCRCLSCTLPFNHCTIDCHLTMQLIMANRYIYQHPHAHSVRQIYVLVFCESNAFLSLSLWRVGERLRRWFSYSCEAETRVRRRAKRAWYLSYDGRGPKIFRELYNPRERFVGTKDVYI